MLGLIFSKIGVKGVAIAIAAIAVVTIIGTAYFHYKGLLDTISVLKENEAKLTAAVDAQDILIDAQGAAITSWEKAQKELQAKIEELQLVAREASIERKRLDGIFSKHNLEVLAARKPGLIERRINDGTIRANRMLECATGAASPYCSNDSGPTGGETSPSEP